MADVTVDEKVSWRVDTMAATKAYQLVADSVLLLADMMVLIWASRKVVGLVV